LLLGASDDKLKWLGFGSSGGMAEATWRSRFNSRKPPPAICALTPLVLRKPDGSVFILSQVDDFDVEVELLKNRPDFMAFLRGLSQEQATISLHDLRKELDL